VSLFFLLIVVMPFHFPFLVDPLILCILPLSFMMVKLNPLTHFQHTYAASAGWLALLSCGCFMIWYSDLNTEPVLINMFALASMGCGLTIYHMHRVSRRVSLTSNAANRVYDFLKLLHAPTDEDADKLTQILTFNPVRNDTLFDEFATGVVDVPAPQQRKFLTRFYQIYKIIPPTGTHIDGFADYEDLVAAN